MRHRKSLPFIFFILLVGVFVWLNNASLKQNEKPSEANLNVSISRQTARVLKVVDGDTIEVGLNGKAERIRLIGIDSPEVLDGRKPVQCFGKESGNIAKEMLVGKTITLELDPTQGEKDEYGRLLRYVFFDSLNFNKFMIDEGYAREYTFKGNFYKYQSEFIQAEKEARESKRGLWQKCIQN